MPLICSPRTLLSRVPDFPDDQSPRSRSLCILTLESIQQLQLLTAKLRSKHNYGKHETRYPSELKPATIILVHAQIVHVVNSLLGLVQRRLVILLHARRCANHAIHGRFNPLSQQIVIYVRSKAIRTDVIRNVRSIMIQ